jgi:NADH dehydrogenase
VPDLAVVTGALSYTGRAVARELRARGLALRTLTNRRVPLAPLDGTPRIEARPLQFEDPSALEDALRGARLLVNTYWVRYPLLASASSAPWRTPRSFYRRRGVRA